MEFVRIRACEVIEKVATSQEARRLLSQIWEAAEADDLASDEERQMIHGAVEVIQQYVDRLQNWKDKR